MKKVQSKRFSQAEKGAALLTAIFAVLLGTLLSVALYYFAVSALATAVNDRDNTQALYLADAGVSHAVALIAKTKKAQYSALLRNGANPLPDSGDELSAPPESGAWSAQESIPAGGVNGGGVTGFGGGRYWVRVKNDAAAGETATTDANGILIITSTGVGQNGATATVEAIVSTESTDYPGFLADGDVKLTNTVKVLGPRGIMQVNGSVNVPGGSGNFTCAEQRFLVTGTSVELANSFTGPLCNTLGLPGSTILFNQPRFVPPVIDADKLRSDFKRYANYVFTDTGAIYPQTNGVERALSLSANEKQALGLQGWSWQGSSKTWSYSSNNPLPDAVYYFKNCNSKISNGGNTLLPPAITILSEGSITINNEPAFQSKLPGYSLVSANDIFISSRLGVINNPGIVYAYGQMKFSNKALIFGGVIAANFYRADGSNGADASDPGGQNLVSRESGVIQFSNDVTIITTGNLGETEAKMVGWREIRY
ncbi:MAG: pilus assembly PilX N-terminal domain-containing protein [Acidobacteriota bacterium]|nr:pilus assembly PilX N-terminal domain-containing protein [Acidobacteriota bacterium]